MAEKLGVSRATLINYEKGYTSINIDVINKIKNAYPEFNFELDENVKPKIINENTIDFKVLFNVLFKSKGYIFLLTLSFTILGTSSSFFIKEIF